MTYTTLRTQFLTTFVRQAACFLVGISLLCASDAVAQGCPDWAQEKLREIDRQAQTPIVGGGTAQEAANAQAVMEKKTPPRMLAILLARAVSAGLPKRNNGGVRAAETVLRRPVLPTGSA